MEDDDDDEGGEIDERTSANGKSRGRLQFKDIVNNVHDVTRPRSEQANKRTRERERVRDVDWKIATEMSQFLLQQLMLKQKTNLRKFDQLHFGAHFICVKL